MKFTEKLKLHFSNLTKQITSWLLSKLQTKTNCSHEITEAVSNRVFVVKDLVRKAEKTVHASRFQLHSDKDLNVTIRLQK